MLGFENQPKQNQGAYFSQYEAGLGAFHFYIREYAN